MYMLQWIIQGYPACRGSVHIVSDDVYAPLDFDTGFMTQYASFYVTF